MKTGPLSFEVPARAEGTRLDRFLTERLDGPTRSALRRWIEEGRVRIGGRPATKPGVPLKAGMRLEVTPPEPVPDAPRPESIPLAIVFEDAHLAVVDKPAGLVVHRGHGHASGTLVNALLGRGMRLAPAGGVERPGIVHRLDRETSGLLVVAKTDEAHRALSRAFAAREVGKRYRAVVWGGPRADGGVIEQAIGRSRSDPTRMAVRGARGLRPAVTGWRVVERLPGFTVLDLDLRTGRTHQIRVHMHAMHHPIVGDARYGGRAWASLQDPARRKAVREFERLALHAEWLSFVHPVLGEPQRFRAPLPDELQRLVARLRGPS